MLHATGPAKSADVRSLSTLCNEDCKVKYLSVVALSFGIAIGCIAVSALSASAAPSFNCGKAHKAAEQAICGYARLEALDRQLAVLYRKMSKHPTALGYGRAALTADQREWMLGRNQCGWDRGCLEEAYLARIEYLQSFK